MHHSRTIAVLLRKMNTGGHEAAGACAWRYGAPGAREERDRASPPWSEQARCDPIIREAGRIRVDPRDVTIIGFKPVWCKRLQRKKRHRPRLRGHPTNRWSPLSLRRTGLQNAFLQPDFWRADECGRRPLR